MKYLSLVIIISVFVFSCADTSLKDISKNKIIVGVFDKNGGSPFNVIDAVESFKIDSEISVRVITASEFISGKTKDVDVYYFAGGSGKYQMNNLGEIGRDKMINLIKEQGKSVIGVCAGAYMLSETPNYPCLNLSGAEAIDLQHDHRGHGLVKFTLTQEGKKYFPELIKYDTNFVYYHEGPVLVNPVSSENSFVSLATMQSDVHTVSGSPKNMTNNRPFVLISNSGKGRVASFVGHPECTPGMRWMLPRMARILTDNPLISYDSAIVKPELYKKEVLFTQELLDLQMEYFWKLFGSEEEKLQAMIDIYNLPTKQSREYIVPMIRDKSSKVRLLAAELIVKLERTEAIEDLESAIEIELNYEVKNKLKDYLYKLESFIN